RADRSHLTIRIIAVVVAAASLAALLRPPTVPSSATRFDAALLVTPGAIASEVNRLRDSLPGIPVYRLSDSIADLSELRLTLPDLRDLHVLGWGLRESFWIGHDDL